MKSEDPHFRLRVPSVLKSRIEDAATRSNRSLNAEIVQRLEDSFDRANYFKVPEHLGVRIRAVAHSNGRTLRHEIHQTLVEKYPVPDLDTATAELVAQFLSLELPAQTKQSILASMNEQIQKYFKELEEEEYQ